MNENTIVSHVRLAGEVTVPPSSKGFGPQMGRKVSHSIDMRFIDAKTCQLVKRYLTSLRIYKKRIQKIIYNRILYTICTRTLTVIYFL